MNGSDDHILNAVRDLAFLRRQTNAREPVASYPRLARLLCALSFFAAVAQSQVVPLFPRLSSNYGLSPVAAAALLAAPALATMTLALPAGLFADRLGVRALAVSGTLVMAASTLVQALPSCAAFVAGRLVFSGAYAVVVTAAMAWMARSTERPGDSRLGSLAAWGAVGSLAGPATGGLLADQVGLGSPFAVAALAAAVLAALLARQPRLTRVHQAPRPGLAASLSGTSVLSSGMCAIFLVGVAGGAVQLLVPLQLHHLGYGASTIGLALSVSAAVYIAVSVAFVRFGDPVTAYRWLAGCVLVLGLTLLPAMFVLSLAPISAAIAMSMAPRAALAVTAFPFVSATAARHTIGAGVALGLMNMAWAAGFVLAPLTAGAIEQTAGVQLAYLTVIVPCFLGAVLMRTGVPTFPRLLGQES